MKPDCYPEGFIGALQVGETRSQVQSNINHDRIHFGSSHLGVVRWHGNSADAMSPCEEEEWIACALAGIRKLGATRKEKRRLEDIVFAESRCPRPQNEEYGRSECASYEFEDLLSSAS